jgi:Cytochrome c7 and related cytochrome c
MGDRFRHAGHVLRVAALFTVGFTAFLVLRWVLIPPDFGIYGFYRAGALQDVAARAPVYAGATTCVECHSDVDEARQGSLHAAVNCEACHGPLARHASGDLDVTPPHLDPKALCLQCHGQLTGKPPTFPQIVPAEHAGTGPCTECHQPHHPKMDGD